MDQRRCNPILKIRHVVFAIEFDHFVERRNGSPQITLFLFCSSFVMQCRYGQPLKTRNFAFLTARNDLIVVCSRSLQIAQLLFRSSLIQQRRNDPRLNVLPTAFAKTLDHLLARCNYSVEISKLLVSEGLRMHNSGNGRFRQSGRIRIRGCNHFVYNFDGSLPRLFPKRCCDIFLKPSFGHFLMIVLNLDRSVFDEIPFPSGATVVGRWNFS